MVVVGSRVLVVVMIPVVVRFAMAVVVLGPYDESREYRRSLSLPTRVVKVGGVGGVVLVDVVLERPGFQMLKTQKLGSVIGADSAPIQRSTIRIREGERLTAKFHSTGGT